MQKKGDSVGGIVQKHQPLQEAGQEWGRLFHKHGQKHPGGRLPPRECPPVQVTEPTASLRSPAIGDIVSQVIQLELLGDMGRG